MPLVYPMLALVGLSFLILLITFVTRVHAVRGGMDVRYFKTLSRGDASEAVLKTGRHFSNLFEVPVLFYVGCLLAMQLGIGGFWMETWAWVFVGARMAHAYIHLGGNRIYPRLASFLLGVIAVFAMWVLIALGLLR